jgi:hypothetical protein
MLQVWIQSRNRTGFWKLGGNAERTYSSITALLSQDDLRNAVRRAR